MMNGYRSILAFYFRPDAFGLPLWMWMLLAAGLSSFHPENHFRLSLQVVLLSAMSLGVLTVFTEAFAGPQASLLPRYRARHMVLAGIWLALITAATSAMLRLSGFQFTLYFLSGIIGAGVVALVAVGGLSRYIARGKTDVQFSLDLSVRSRAATGASAWPWTCFVARRRLDKLRGPAAKSSRARVRIRELGLKPSYVGTLVNLVGWVLLNVILYNSVGSDDESPLSKEDLYKLSLVAPFLVQAFFVDATWRNGRMMGFEFLFPASRREFLWEVGAVQLRHILRPWSCAVCFSLLVAAVVTPNHLLEGSFWALMGFSGCALLAFTGIDAWASAHREREPWTQLAAFVAWIIVVVLLGLSIAASPFRSLRAIGIISATVVVAVILIVTAHRKWCETDLA